jgi:hypothetical protein
MMKQSEEFETLIKEVEKKDENLNFSKSNI